jgi:hypothetical protein
MRLDEGWNQIQFNLSDFTRRAYGKHAGRTDSTCHTQPATSAASTIHQHSRQGPVQSQYPPSCFSLHPAAWLAHHNCCTVAPTQRHHNTAHSPPLPPPPLPCHTHTLPFCAGTNYIETLRVQIHANCRIRRIYFSDRLYSEEELPPEFKLFLPIQKA